MADNIARLRSWGVTVLYGDDVYPLHDPGTSSRYLDRFPWHPTLETLDTQTRH